MSIPRRAHIFFRLRKNATLFTSRRPMRAMKEKKGLFNFLKTCVEQWLAEGPFQLAAALAYYTLFSLSPLLIIMTGIVGSLAGHETAQNYIYNSVSGLVGEQSAKRSEE